MNTLELGKLYQFIESKDRLRKILYLDEELMINRHCIENGDLFFVLEKYKDFWDRDDKEIVKILTKNGLFFINPDKIINIEEIYKEVK